MDIYSASYKSKYERWYYNIIVKAKSQLRFKSGDVYYEFHHILPKSLGGVESDENMVLLTYREHLLCHWLLYKFSEGENKAKMAYAFWAMCQLVNDHHKRVPPLRVLDSARQAHIKELSEKMSGEGNPMFGKAGFGGKKHSQDHIEKISGSGNPMFGKTHSKESREKMSNTMRGKKRKPFTEETKQKMSKNAKRRRKKILPNGKWTWEYID